MVYLDDCTECNGKVLILREWFLFMGAWLQATCPRPYLECIIPKSIDCGLPRTRLSLLQLRGLYKSEMAKSSHEVTSLCPLPGWLVLPAYGPMFPGTAGILCKQQTSMSPLWPSTPFRHVPASGPDIRRSLSCLASLFAYSQPWLSPCMQETGRS